MKTEKLKLKMLKLTFHRLQDLDRFQPLGILFSFVPVRIRHNYAEWKKKMVTCMKITKTK